MNMESINEMRAYFRWNADPEEADELNRMLDTVEHEYALDKEAATDKAYADGEKSGSAAALARIAETHLELPKDADGIPIHPHDTLYRVSTGERIDGEYVYGVSADHVYIFLTGEGKFHGIVGELPKNFTHREPVSVESILDAFADGLISRCNESGVALNVDYSDLVREAAANLRLKD